MRSRYAISRRNSHGCGAARVESEEQGERGGGRETGREIERESEAGREGEREGGREKERGGGYREGESMKEAAIGSVDSRLVLPEAGLLVSAVWFLFSSFCILFSVFCF